MKHPHVLIVSTTTGYQTRSFAEAAGRLGISLALATDRCDQLEDPWSDAAIPIRFYDEAGSLERIVDAARERPIDGIVAVGDRPTVIAALAASALGLPWHPVGAADISHNKAAMRAVLARKGLPCPWFERLALPADSTSFAGLTFPCVVKPLKLSGSRGVIRADNVVELRNAVERLQRLLVQKELRAMRDPDADALLVEGFIPGREYALEGILECGQLHTLAVFEKPDPLNGPFFEETIYLTPPRMSAEEQSAIRRAVFEAAEAIGLCHGPVHAECRVSDGAVFVLEVAARPIGGLCSRALRFGTDGAVSLEEVLLRHAVGEPVSPFTREAMASGVMMIPIPRRGIYRDVKGVDDAEAVACVTEVRVTTKPDSMLVPLPEGASYLGFIFARAAATDAVEDALREAHRRLEFIVEPSFTILDDMPVS